MLNLKLQTIASLVTKDDYVLDLACDHAYLAIYLKQNNLCREVYASDISPNALNEAKKNIKNASLNIKTYLSDGFKNIPNLNLNTVIISGVGTKTIIDILEYAPNNIEKYILSSNNNHAELRRYMYKNGFYNTKEIVIKDHHKYYPIILFTKAKTKETTLTLKYGKSSNLEYYNYLLTKEKTILKSIPNFKIASKLSHLITILELKKTLKERK